MQITSQLQIEGALAQYEVRDNEVLTNELLS
jgi:hypothetical protein